MIGGQILRDSIISGANNILNNQKYIDTLNVFPVPDGDTGSNMARTINAAKILLETLDDNVDVEHVMKTTASALLRGARGNSGVILSVIFRGFSKATEKKIFLTLDDVVLAFKFATEAAYGAVSRPTEGTILTVIRTISKKSEDIIKEAKSFGDFWIKICAVANDILEETPQMLPMLAEAGVVDAGGKGLTIIFEGMKSVFAEQKIIELQPDINSIKFKNNAEIQPVLDEKIEFGYCTEFLINKNQNANCDISKLESFLSSIGDSVVIVDDVNITKIHVHSNNPGKILDEALKYGSLLDVKIDNLREEVSSREKPIKLVNKIFEYQQVNEGISYGFVAVASGSGIEDLFAEMGVNNIVTGEQSMNPSTDEILNAIHATPAKIVFVLPNNKNIIMSAEQAASLADREVVVLPTRTIPQGISAMLAFNEHAQKKENQIEMISAIEKVKTGLITFAVRNSKMNNQDIQTGDILAMENSKLKFVEKDRSKACIKLLKSLVKKQSSYITLIYGEDISKEEANILEEQIKQKFNSIDINVIYGGQPIYYFIIAVE